MTNIAVIDAAFGDCGKGLMTDFHAQRLGADGERVAVVRFNGGAQAGHTVITPNGRRHVFSHFGAGTFAGASTHLSRFFITNPILFGKEWRELRHIGLHPDVTIDGRSPVTTPWDMLLNHLIERKRRASGGEHGSVGLGIHETMVRTETVPLLAADLLDHHRRAEILAAVEHEWAPRRAAFLGVEAEFAAAAMGLARREFAAGLEAIELYASIDPEGHPPWARHIVFEGAQGLLLDSEHSFFPHVTHSRTGMTNVATLHQEWGLQEGVDICYVLRAYMTRHGAGPFPTEDASLRYQDDTNAPNEHQGRMRFGLLDCGLIGDAIRADMKVAKPVAVESGLTVTHLDQLGEVAKVVSHRRKVAVFSPRTLPAAVAEMVQQPPRYASWGPTRCHIMRAGKAPLASAGAA